MNLVARRSIDHPWQNAGNAIYPFKLRVVIIVLSLDIVDVTVLAPLAHRVRSSIHMFYLCARVFKLCISNVFNALEIGIFQSLLWLL